VKLLEKTDTQLNYAYLRIPLTEFDKRVVELRQAGKIHEYIKVASTKEQETKK
jgi:hypothetical protein